MCVCILYWFDTLNILLYNKVFNLIQTNISCYKIGPIMPFLTASLKHLQLSLFSENIYFLMTSLVSR